MASNDSQKKTEDPRRRYVVKEKDTLEAIAKKQLRDVRLAALIYEINKHMLPLRREKGKQVAEPRAGTSIWLPSESEIDDFRRRLYAASPTGPSSHSAKRGSDGKEPPSVIAQEECPPQSGQKWQGGPSPSIISADLMDVAVAKSQLRQSNIEKVLGPLAPPSAPEGSRIRYIVRLSDTIEGVAIKHPVLKDIDLWPLLAKVNNLPDGLDARGRPLAELKRGMVLIIPSLSEIEAFRSGTLGDPLAPFGGSASVAQSPGSFVGMANSNASYTSAGVDLDGPTIKVPVSLPSPQPGVAFPQLPTTQDPPQVSLPASLFQSNLLARDDQPTVSLKPAELAVSGAATAPQLSEAGVPPAAELPAANNPLNPLIWQGAPSAESQYSETQVLPQQSKPAQQGAPLPQQLAQQPAQPPSLPSTGSRQQSTNVKPDSGDRQPQPTTVEASHISSPTIIPVNRPTAAQIMKRAPIVIGDRYVWELDRIVRLVKSAVRWDPAVGVFRCQLEVMYDATWYPVILYEIFPQGAVRHEYVAGSRRKSVNMDLPPSAVQELADNDLINNWQAYCQRFVGQLTGPKS